MSKNGREWTPMDRAVSEFFKALKEENNLSLRFLADKLGVSKTRVMNLLQGDHGTPTMQEFIAICEYFNKNPAETLQQILDNSVDIERRENERKRQELLAEIDSLHDDLADKLRLLGDLQPVANEHPYLDQDTDFDD